MSVRPPRVRTITFIPCNRLIYQTQDLGSIGLLLVLQSRPPDLALYEISVRRPGTLPARTPRPDIRLPSDSTSRWTPLPSANASCYRARSGLSPPSYRPCRAHKKERRKSRRTCFFCVLSLFDHCHDHCHDQCSGIYYLQIPDVLTVVLPEDLTEVRTPDQLLPDPGS